MQDPIVRESLLQLCNSCGLRFTKSPQLCIYETIAFLQCSLERQALMMAKIVLFCVIVTYSDTVILDFHKKKDFPFNKRVHVSVRVSDPGWVISCIRTVLGSPDFEYFFTRLLMIC